jgi:hypothetical protein
MKSESNQEDQLLGKLGEPAKIHHQDQVTNDLVQS